AEPPPGPLRWTPQTISAIKTLRLEGSVNQITAYLRKVAPDRVRDKSDAEMSALVKQSVHTGTELGIRSMAAHCRWAYLSLVTHGTLPKAPAVREFMTMEDTKFSPDERVRMLMQGTISSLKTKAGSH
ncbi:hypothetical protein, partial [Rhizobium sp. FKY42]|uniref:hypothetical protein n=1 Tax=Rhizobium sp. FKY42 TaxID=2562310 RepID=UPI0014857BDD